MSTDLELQIDNSLKKIQIEFSAESKKNALKNVEEKTAFKTKLESAPIKLRIELTNECNLRCVFCYKSYFNHKDKLHLSMDQFAKLEPFLKKAKFLTFFTKSEPLVGKNLQSVLEKTKNYQAVTYFSTNGIPLTEEKAEWLVKNKLTFLTISVNHFKPEDYARVYRGGSLTKLEENLTILNKIKSKYNSEFPRLRLSVCGDRDAMPELEDAVRFAKKHKMSEGVQVTPFYEVGEEHKGKTYEDDPQYFRNYYNKAKKLAQELEVPFFIISDQDNPSEVKYCYEPWEAMNIEPNGEVFPCSVSNMKMGNINDESIESIWNSPKYQNFRAKVNIDTPDQNPECKSCLNCHLHKLKTSTNTARPLKQMNGGYYRVKQ